MCSELRLDSSRDDRYQYISSIHMHVWVIQEKVVYTYQVQRAQSDHQLNVAVVNQEGESTATCRMISARNWCQTCSW